MLYRDIIVYIVQNYEITYYVTMDAWIAKTKF